MSFCFSILGTGSAGNCAYLRTPQARILIDGGFSAKKTAQLLAPLGVTLAEIDAVFLSHEHGDHAAIVQGLARQPHIQLFANAPTSRAVQRALNFQPPWQLFETGSRFTFRDLEVDTFSVPHDAQDPAGFIFSHGASEPERRRLAWLTDLGHAPQHIHERIRDIDVLVVEANHCSRMLQADTKRPWSLKQRISGRHGHLSNQSTRELLDAVASPRWKHIFLTHLSRDCNSPEAVRLALADCASATRCALSILAPGEATPLHEFH